MSMYYLIVNEEKDSGCQVAKGIQAYMQEAGHRVLVQTHDAIDIQEKMRIWRSFLAETAR